MPDLVTLAGLSTTVLDFTDALSPLLIGLLGLLYFSAGVIVCSAARHYWAQKAGVAPLAAPTSTVHQEAA